MSSPSFTPPLAVQRPPLESYPAAASPSDSSTSSSIIIVIIIIASAVIVSASIYLLLRLLSRRFHRSFRTFSAGDDVVVRRGGEERCQSTAAGVLDALPLFTFRSVTGSVGGGDCAVCLSKFEPHDQLRLLPICCHAFHADCIDAWIVSNQTCPLCRSTVLPSECDALDKVLSGNDHRGVNNGSDLGSSGSFRIEIGSVSRRRGADAADSERRSYSIGSFDYIVDGNGYEIPVGSTTHRREVSDTTSIDKESSVGIPIPAPPGEVLAAEVSGGRNWLREYVDRLASVSISSRAMSFRSSGRFFSGSSCRSDASAVAAAAAVAAASEDLEVNRAGEEISELFRWLSGI